MKLLTFSGSAESVALEMNKWVDEHPNNMVLDMDIRVRENLIFGVIKYDVQKEKIEKEKTDKPTLNTISIGDIVKYKHDLYSKAGTVIMIDGTDTEYAVKVRFDDDSKTWYAIEEIEYV